MLARLKSDQRRAQPIGLPVCLAFAPVAGVAGNPEQYLVMSPVLIQLIGVAALHLRSLARRAQQGQPDGVIIALVRAILHIGQDCGPKRTARVGLIDPVMRGYFELPLGCGGPLNGADLPVVGGNLVGRRKRKHYLEIRRESLPVD